MQAEDGKLSTTALARKLEIPVQQLFATLRDYGWIRRVGENWALTPKGEFEGGSYRRSQRYGSYIVWPENVDQHPMLAGIESNQRLSAPSLSRDFPGLHAQQVNRALAEIGLQRRTVLGWELTELGHAFGGQQEESRNSNALYVTWPHEFVDHPVIRRELSQLSGQPGGTQAAEGDADLFDNAAACSRGNAGIDGHELRSPLQTRVCDWLYVAQLAHAVRRALPVEELVYSDFYLPRGSVYIDCWEEHASASELSGRLRKRELYRLHELRHIELNERDSQQLDEVLGKGLLAFGIRC